MATSHGAMITKIQDAAGTAIRVLRPVLCACLATFIPLASAVAALNQISYSNGIDPPIFVSDGDGADLDPDPAEMQVLFNLTGAGGDWNAQGVIFATTSDPAGATLVVTDTQIRNVTGNYVLGAIIEVNHYFDPLVSFTQQYTAHIDGAFDKIGGGILGNLNLSDAAILNGAVQIDSFFFAAGLEAAPKTFNDTSLPLHLDTVNRQTERFIFYIDELDNVINLFDSATIQPAVSAPVPAVGANVLVALALGLVLLGFAVLRLRPTR
jgi:hypothetical protein